MNKRFSVKSKYFSLYQAFREEAEKAGWVYNNVFNEFSEGKMLSCDCLFFAIDWDHGGRNPKFAFSNHYGEVFELPAQWDDAVEYMKKLINSRDIEKKEKFSISLKELAAHHGVEVENIIITA